AESRIQTGLLKGVEGTFASPGDLTNEIEILFVKARRKLVDDRGKKPCRPWIHMLDCIDPEAIDVCQSHPEFVDLAEGQQRVRWLIRINGSLPEVEIFQIKKITVEKFRFIIPIGNMALSGKDCSLLELYGPDGPIWPCGGMLFQIDEFKRQARSAVGIVETSHRVWTPVPARIHSSIDSCIAVRRVAKH